MLKVHDSKSFFLYVVLAVAVVCAVNFVSRDLFFRLDLTDNQMYSLSESSQKVVQKIEDRLTMKVYFTDNLPGQYGNNRRYLQDILEEYEAYGDGNIRFEIYQPENDEKLAEEARKYGIQPVQLQVVENDKLEVKRVYMGMVFLYGDSRETIPVIESTTGLEYDVTTQIKKLVDSTKPSIAFLELGEASPEIQNVSAVLRQSYQVRNAKLTRDIPNDVGLLIVSDVQDTIKTEEMDRLKAFVRRGGNLFIAQSRVKGDLREQRGTSIQSNFFDFLGELGLNMKENLVLDEVNSPITITQRAGFLRMNSQVPYPLFPIVQRFGDHLTVSGLEQVRTLFASEIEVDPTVSPDSTSLMPLLFTSDRSGEMTGYYHMSPIDNPFFKNTKQPGKVIGALNSVTLDSSTSVSQVVLVSDSEFFTDSGGGAFPENFIFVANVVDFLMGDSDLVALRSREITTRPLQVLEDESKTWWKWFNILMPPFLIIAYGLVRWRREMGRARALEERYG